MPLPSHETIKQILLSLDVAILEAKAELPEHLRWEHDALSRSRQFVDVWREVQERYRTRNQEPERAVEHTLDALCLLLDCKGKLNGVLQEACDLPPPDLRLTRMRGSLYTESCSRVPPPCYTPPGIPPSDEHPPSLGPGGSSTDESGDAQKAGVMTLDALIVAFVQGVQWWDYYTTGTTMWARDRERAEAEAETRAAHGTLGKSPNNKETPQQGMEGR